MTTIGDDCRDQVLHLLQDGLYESAEVVCSMILSSLPPQTGRGADKPGSVNAVFLELLADSLFAQGQYKRAVNYFQQALQCCGLRGRNIESKEGARLTYKSALCHTELRDGSGAVRLLESIPAPLRNVKVCIAMGKQYAEMGLKKSAIGCYKQVLALLPSSVEAVEKLVTLGLESSEIIEIITKSCSKSPQLELFLQPWLPKLVVALDYKSKCRSAAAFTSFAELSSAYPRNFYLLTNTAQAATSSRQHGPETAVISFKAARSIDRCCPRGMDTYGSVLQATGDARELAALSQDLLSLHKSPKADSSEGIGDNRPPCGEAWVCAAMHAELKGESDRALDFINKAIQMQPLNAVAHKLKGNMLLARERPEEAVVVYHESNSIVKDVQCYEGIAKAYVSIGRVSDAVLVAKECVLIMQQCPEAYALMGSVLAGTVSGKAGAIKCYMRALKLDPGHEAVLDAMAAQLGKLDKADDAIKCLETVVKRRPSTQLLIRLAKLLTAHSGTPHAAIEYLNEAIHLADTGSSHQSEIAEELEAAERLMRGDDRFDDGDEDDI